MRGDGPDRRLLSVAGQAHAVAVAAVVALTAVNYAGVQKSAWLTRVIVAVVLAVLAAVVIVTLGFGERTSHGSDIGADVTAGGVLQAAGLLFFAFAGYARIATLGEEVRDPARTIPRAIPLALGITLVVYAVVAVAVLTVLGRTAWLTRPPRCRRRRAAGGPAGAGRPGRAGGRRARITARADPRGVPHHPGDGP